MSLRSVVLALDFAHAKLKFDLGNVTVFVNCHMKKKQIYIIIINYEKFLFGTIKHLVATQLSTNFVDPTNFWLKQQNSIFDESTKLWLMYKNFC